MIRVTYRCPKCERTARVDVSQQAPSLACPHCGHSREAGQDPHEGHQLHHCLICGSSDLFIRKAFPQRMGVTIVVFGFAASCVSWYYHRVLLTFGILFGTALVDVVLYLLMSDVLECYRCHAQYGGVADYAQHGPFALETHEKYRQQAARAATDDRGPMHAGGP